MKFHSLPLAGAGLIELDRLGDDRGFFARLFCEREFAAAGLVSHFVQVNNALSRRKGTLRGLHYQHTPPQGRLVGVIRGRVWDVAVDIRKDSNTFGQYYGVELSGDNGMLFWMPAGFAHGFCVLGDEPADMLYKVTGLYNQAGEGGILYNDPDLKIDWPISNPQVSERDTNLMSWKDYCKNIPEWKSL